MVYGGTPVLNMTDRFGIPLLLTIQLVPCVSTRVGRGGDTNCLVSAAFLCSSPRGVAGGISFERHYLYYTTKKGADFLNKQGWKGVNKMVGR